MHADAHRFPSDLEHLHAHAAPGKQQAQEHAHRPAAHDH
jgi:hypothetical protein